MRYTITPVTQFQQNCSLVWCAETMRGAFVDPGGDLPILLQKQEKNGVTIEKVLLTHGHIDHVGQAAELARHFDVPIEGPHRDDLEWLNGLPLQAQMFGHTKVEPFTPDRWLDCGDEATVGALRLQVRHCPGHTPGHVIFHHAESKIAFVGDVLFRGSIGRTDFPRGNHDDLIRSIRTKLWPLGDDTRFVPGHGPMSTFGRERAQNPFVADHLFASAA